MSTTSMQLELVTPEKKLFSDAVHMAILPNFDGYVGVMKGHVPTITRLAAGIMSWQDKADGPTTEYYIAGGFAEVTLDKCVILADEAIAVKDLSLADIEKHASNIRTQLETTKAEHEKILLGRKLKSLELQIMLLQNPEQKNYKLI